MALHAGTSMLLGALIAFLFLQLGVLDAAGFRDYTSDVSSIALVGLVLGFFRAGRRTVIGVAGVFFAVYLVVAFTEVVSGPTTRWVRADTLPSNPVDAVIVLSSDIRRDSTVDSDAIDRLLTGLELAKSRGIRRFITTRTTMRVYDQSVSSDVDQGRVVHLAGLDSIWTVIDSVHTTHDEAMRIRRALFPAGARTIAVVTNPMHTRRACLTFEAVGFRVYCVPARMHGSLTRHPWSPGDHLAAFREYFYERLGMMKYRWNGWLPAGAAGAP